jgi:hypothetical protein
MVLSSEMELCYQWTLSIDPNYAFFVSGEMADGGYS